METGWIKLHRQTLENQFLMNDNNAFIVFTKLLLLAHNKTGEYTTGRFALAEHVNLKPNTLYSVLVRLESQKLINITSNNKYSVIRICNWNKYQRVGNTTDNIAATTRQQPDNNATTLNKNKELRIKNNKVTNVTMSSPKNSTAGITYKQLFFELVKTLGFSAQTVPTKERLAKLKTRLSSYTPEQLTQAASALAADSRMQGDNEAGKRWGNIDYLIRNDTNVAKYLELSDGSSTDVKEALKDVRW